jgi:hypothetical protein
MNSREQLENEKFVEELKKWEEASTEEMRVRMENLWPTLDIGTEDEVLSNRFTGVSISCPPRFVALHDFLIGFEIMPIETKKKFYVMAGKNPDKAIEEDSKNYAAARVWLMVNYPEMYMALLD